MLVSVHGLFEGINESFVRSVLYENCCNGNTDRCNDSVLYETYRHRPNCIQQKSIGQR